MQEDLISITIYSEQKSEAIRSLEQKTNILNKQNLILSQQLGPSSSKLSDRYLSTSILITPRDIHQTDKSCLLTTTRNSINPGLLVEQRTYVSKLEEELETERRSRRNADSEIIKLRAEINGVILNDADVDALLPKIEDKVPIEVTSKNEYTMSDLTEKNILINSDDTSDSQLGMMSTTMNNVPTITVGNNIPARVTDVDHKLDTNVKASNAKDIPPLIYNSKVEIISKATNVFGVKKERKIKSLRDIQISKDFLPRLSGEFLPTIKRGYRGEKSDMEDNEVIAVGWRVEVTNRKEREEALCDEAHRFEVKMSHFYSTIQEGVEVTMWQMNLINDHSLLKEDNFTLKSTPVYIKLHYHGNYLAQTALAFTMKGTYFSKALNRRRAIRSALEPLPLTEILGVKAGCYGYDHVELPISGKNKTTENRYISHFLTLKASRTAVSSSRIYYLKFKSRSARDDLLMGLRRFLADLQIHEGLSISRFHKERDPLSHQFRFPDEDNYRQSRESPDQLNSQDNITIPLSDVYGALDKERESYDRILLMLLQGTCDLREKEDDIFALKGRLDFLERESKEKNKNKENDSKLIEQLSKKLEKLLMENEELRDENERLRLS